MRRAVVAALGRLRAATALKEQLQLLRATATHSGQAGVVAAPRHGGVAALAAALAGGAALNYGFGAGGAALAEAPVALPAVAEIQGGTPAPAGVNPYELPTTTHGLPQSILLYQYEVCPFCCKVKAFLDYHNLPYRVVEVNPLTKAELKWSQYKKVPVVLLDGKEQLNDSSAIVSRLAAELAAAEAPPQRRRSWLAKTKARAAAAGGVHDREEEERWRRWVDDRLVRVITVNIYRNARESFQTFDYIAEHGNFSWPQREAARVVGATLMWGLSRRLRKKYGVEGDVREALYGCADEWVAALGERHFLGGDKPNLADLSTFGVMRSVVGTDTFMDLMHNTRVAPWYERMMEAVGEPARVAEA